MSSWLFTMYMDGMLMKVNERVMEKGSSLRVNGVGQMCLQMTLP